MLKTATVQFWLEETGAMMMGAEVPRLRHGMTSNAELHFWQSAQSLTACPGKEKILREKSKTDQK